MSTTSIADRLVVAGGLRECDDADSVPASQQPIRAEGEPLDLPALVGWPRILFETLAFVAVIKVLQYAVLENVDLPGLPHPYWLPVLLASAQYGTRGGVIATIVVCAAYFLDLPPQSAAEDFYAYAKIAAVQPAVWLATALVVGGLRNLHIHHAAELGDRLTQSHRRTADLAGGLSRALAEAAALERRIAADRSSIATVSRILSQLDLRTEAVVAARFAELFAAMTGASAFTIYLRDAEGYSPVWAVEDDNAHPVHQGKPLDLAAIGLPAVRCDAAGQAAGDEAGEAPIVIRVPPSDAGVEPTGLIVCHGSGDPAEADRLRVRADELSRAFAVLLAACEDRNSEASR